MLRFAAQAVSFVFHPLFMVLYMLLFLLYANPYGFGLDTTEEKVRALVSVITLSVLIPMIAIAMMSMLGMVSGIELRDQKDRIGPIIAAGICYLWLYVNIRSNTIFPGAFSFFILGSIIALFAGLAINSFSKISLHAIGTGGLFAGLFIATSFYTYGYLSSPLKLGDRYYLIHTDLCIITAILIAGLAGSARLYLKAHKEDELYGGYFTGILSQFVAFALYF
ncbi:MAG: hypothetical protein IPM26_13395 [Saprospiraceae bacterium]|nr:hypothetical protein [Saprospiraceae bacterium]